MLNKNIYFDLETSGFSPPLNNIITGGFVATDTDHNILDKAYLTSTVGTQRYKNNILGYKIDQWPEQAQRVHKITWEDQLKFDQPIDFYRKLWLFLEQYKDDRLTFIFHASGTFDLNFLLYHSNLHAPKMYQYLVKRLGQHIPLTANKDGEYTTSMRSENTMTLAREYNKIGSNKLKLASKHQKMVDKMDSYINKLRKTPAKPEKMLEWKDKRAEANNELALMDNLDIVFNGVGLDELCSKLDIKHNHHNSLSDSEVLVPIHRFFKKQLS